MALKDNRKLEHNNFSLISVLKKISPVSTTIAASSNPRGFGH